MSGVKRIARLLAAALAAFILAAPAVLTLGAGGWPARAAGAAALLVWLVLGRWVWQAWREWRQNNFEDYV